MFYCIQLITLHNSITVYNCMFFRYYNIHRIGVYMGDVHNEKRN